MYLPSEGAAGDLLLDASYGGCGVVANGCSGIGFKNWKILLIIIQKHIGL